MPPLRLRLKRGLAIAIAAVAVILAFDSASHLLMAQNPFGGPRPAAAAEPQIGGIVGWILSKQSEFYREISAAIRSAKSDGSAVWTLLAISFAYGIFHAAGPGHGKAVISSYLVANQETARRGVALSFASALMQSLVAVVIVAICAWLLNATASTMCNAEKVIEIASYGLIAAFGARLVWTKGGGFMRALQLRITIIMITTMATIMSMTNIAATPTVRRRANSKVPAAGGAAWARSSRSGCGRVRGRSWCWYSHWHRACSGPASPRPSSWVSAPRSRLRPSPSSRSPPRTWRGG
jgi:hypothetical protein